MTETPKLCHFLSIQTQIYNSTIPIHPVLLGRLAKGENTVGYDKGADMQMVMVEGLIKLLSAMALSR